MPGQKETGGSQAGGQGNPKPKVVCTEDGKLLVFKNGKVPDDIKERDWRLRTREKKGLPKKRGKP